MCPSPAVPANLQGPSVTDAASAAGDDVRWQEASFDLAFPPVPFPSRRVFAIAGEPMLRALVKRHHERLRDSSIGNLFPRNPDRFAKVVENAADFVVAATGGPTRLAPSHDHAAIRTRHLPFTIDETARNVWLANMLMAFDDIEFPAEARLEYWNWIEALSIRVITRRTMTTQPRRYPLEEAPIALRPFMRASPHRTR